LAQTRTVTILFCDLVGSTALMTRLGDDANDRLRRRLFAALREAVSAHRGEEVKSAGDGMMVAFPASAADAVSCAVAMQRAVSRMRASDPLLGLAVRVGLSSGEASNEDNDWFGAPVVEAARLENAARTGQILCADVTRMLVGNRGGHTFTAVGALELKGLPEPLPACDVAWEPDPGLPAIPLPSGLARVGLSFAGRANELVTLRTAWEDALAGERHFVLISGEQGIGKTRLAAEFAAAVHGASNVVLYGRCETDREVPYQPFAEALRWYVLAGKPASLREEVGAAGGELTRIVPALRMRLPDLPAPRAGGPMEERQALFDAVLHTLTAVAERSPVLLVIDDLEQAGAQTLALLSHVVSSPERVPLLVVALAAEPLEGSPLAAEAAAIRALPGSIEIRLAGLATAEIALLLERVEAPGAGPALAERIQRETEGSPRFVADLVARLQESGGEPQAVLDAACPYMGLRSFEAADSGLYFGRDEVIGALLGRLATNRLLSVVGASGSGKSSLVRAGLVPRLRDGALPGSRDWEVLLITPGAHPLAELASRLGALAGLSAASILRDLEADVRTFDLTVRQALADRPESARVLLVADQFEELFTLCRDEAERQRFIDALLTAIGIPGGRTMAILAMRADFYGEAARYPGLAEALEVSHALLGPMSQDDLLAAIERPAAATGLRVEPGLSERILRDVGDEPGGLPLLSHALLETWKRRDGRTLTAAGYAAAGGVRGAIAQTAETVYGALSAADQAIARNLFVRLTELGEGTEDTRRRVAFSEVVPEGATGEAVRDVITRLADARLLTTSADSVEVAHEALIREWPRLRLWLDDDREGLRLMRHLTESAQAWERLGRDPGELYRGARLTAALEWVDRGRL
jgi:class 3 adenylate cyclase